MAKSDQNFTFNANTNKHFTSQTCYGQIGCISLHANVDEIVTLS